MFNLSNDEEVLTHHGRILQDLEKFDNPQSESDDDEDGKLEGCSVIMKLSYINIHEFKNEVI